MGENIHLLSQGPLQAYFIALLVRTNDVIMSHIFQHTGDDTSILVCSNDNRHAIPVGQHPTCQPMEVQPNRSVTGKSGRVFDVLVTSGSRCPCDHRGAISDMLPALGQSSRVSVAPVCRSQVGLPSKGLISRAVWAVRPSWVSRCVGARSGVRLRQVYIKYLLSFTRLWGMWMEFIVIFSVQMHAFLYWDNCFVVFQLQKMLPLAVSGGSVRKKSEI